MSTYSPLPLTTCHCPTFGPRAESRDVGSDMKFHIFPYKVSMARTLTDPNCPTCFFYSESIQAGFQLRIGLPSRSKSHTSKPLG